MSLPIISVMTTSLYCGPFDPWIPNIQNSPWDITFHGWGENRNNLVEGNLCEGKLAVDDEHESNGTNNTFYRNICKTQIEVEKIGDCQSGNDGQRFILNKVWKRGLTDRWKVKADNHTIKGNSKCNSSGGSCNTGSFGVGYCGFFPFGNQNTNTPLSGGQRGGQTAYLLAVPSYMTSLPVFASSNSNAASSRESVEETGCFSCKRVISDVPVDTIGKRATDDVELELTSTQAVEKTSREAHHFNVFPNPFTDEANLALNLVRTDHVRATLRDMQGKVVEVLMDGKKEEGRYVVSVKRQNLPSGMYFVHITYRGGQHTLKVMIH